MLKPLELRYTFDCIACEKAAQEVKEDDQLVRVSCAACGVSVESPEATLMFETLVRRHLEQVSRNRRDQIVKQSKLGRMRSSRNVKVSYSRRSTRIDKTFSDPRWPFALKPKDDG